MGKEIRDNKLDIIKGIGIILMVVGHSGSPLKTWIYLFHMPLFFIVSGFCIRDRYSETIADMWNFVKKKIRALYIPCLFFTLFILFCHNILVRFFIIDGEIYKTKQFVIGIAKCLCFSGGGQLSGAMWFFRTMFLSSVLYVLVEFFCKRVSHRYFDIVKSTVFFLILFIVWLIPNTTGVYKYLNCLTMLIILQLGHLMFKYQNILLGGGVRHIYSGCVVF